MVIKSENKTQLGWIILGWLVVVGVLSPTFFRFYERGDLRIILNAAEKLNHRQPIYNIEESNEHTKVPLLTAAFIPLNRLPLTLVERLWDLLNILVPLWLVFTLASKLETEKAPCDLLMLLTFLILLNPWNTEITFGQTNVLILAAVLLSVLEVPPILQAACMIVAALFKPPFLIFLPWILKYRTSKKRLFISLTGVSFFSVGLFIGYFGWENFVKYHVDWLNFLPLTSQKYIYAPSNFGLPSFLASYFHIKHSSVILFLGSFLISVLITRKTTQKEVSFSLIALLVAISTPISWYQNYSLLFGFVILVFRDFLSEPSWTPKKIVLGFSLLALIVGFPLNNPEINHLAIGNWFYSGNRIPLFATLISVFLWGLAKTLFKKLAGNSKSLLNDRQLR